MMKTKAMLLWLIVLGTFEVPNAIVNRVKPVRQRSRAKFIALANSGNCNVCRLHEELKALSLEAIKEQILNKLGLKQAPNMTGRALPRVPPISKLMDMYGMQSDQPQQGFKPGLSHYDEIDQFSAKTESIFVFAQPQPRLRHSKGNLEVLYFKFSDTVIQHRVTQAALSLWIRGNEDLKVHEEDDYSVREKTSSDAKMFDSKESPITITLQRIIKGSSESSGLRLGPSLITKHRRPTGRDGTWVTIDIKKMTSEWFMHPKDNLGVAIKISGPNNKRYNKSSRVVETSSGSHNAPYIEVQIQEVEQQHSSRVKRNVGLNCEEGSQETRCCRYKLTVDFEKFGWDWIIAPKKYDANYCSGDCPMAFLPAYPNTHIVSLAEPPNTTGPCCAPRKLSEITMLYFDNEYQIVFSRLPGMVVERCGCS